MSAYYNENDPFAAAWLRELIKAGLIADGEVDERSIEDLRADDVRGFTQCHFFAGIGGWSYALRLAGWPDVRPVWTGSCPCQPFSSAGQGASADDPRHLWPTWFRLISECRPHVVFGEQVASPDGLGWLDLVHTDLEGTGYAIGACDLCAAGIGAPHIRQRLYFVADTENAERWSGPHRDECEVNRLHLRTGQPRRADADTGGRSTASDMGNTDDARSQGRIEYRDGSDECVVRAPSMARFWDACDWIPCTDGKARPVEPGTFPLAHGLSARVGRLRGYGNAISPQAAATFIAAYLDVRSQGAA